MQCSVCLCYTLTVSLHISSTHKISIHPSIRPFLSSHLIPTAGPWHRNHSDPIRELPGILLHIEVSIHLSPTLLRNELNASPRFRFEINF